ncbi:hypothetical protein JXA34_04200 [Patescibacteria group bacterium]|nr:hypothetical protein [Patescibacteria group bacterium]
MIEIYIDTSKRGGKEVRILKDGGLIDSMTGEIDVVDSLSKLLVKNGIKISKINGCNFFKGPGSFTGLKVGCAISNTINWALKLKEIEQLEQPVYGSQPNIQMPEKSL